MFDNNKQLKKGSFVVFEGPRGVGKSSCVQNIYEYLLSKGVKVKKTYEIGGTLLAEDLRNIVLKKNYDMDDEMIILLMITARRSHVKKINKFLEEGYIVLCDRFLYSTIVYQGWLNKIDKYLDLHDDFCYGLYPDKVIFLDGDDDVIYNRIIKRNRQKDNYDFEKEKAYKINKDYRKIYSCFKAINKFKDTIKLVNVNREILEVQEEILKLI